MNTNDLIKLNWARGVDRLYNVAWGINLTYWCIAAIGRSLQEWIGMLILAGISPYFVKKLIAWVYRGFVE